MSLFFSGDTHAEGSPTYLSLRAGRFAGAPNLADQRVRGDRKEYEVLHLVAVSVLPH